MPRKAAAIRTFDFSKPFQTLQADSFFRFTAEYPDKEGASVYFYRILPKIDRGLVGLKDNYIDVVKPPVDENYVRQHHGSGKFHLKFSDANRPSGANSMAKTTFEIDEPDLPPVYDPRELVVGYEGNRPYLQKLLAQAWTIDEEGKMQPPSQGARTDGGVVSAAFDKGAELAARRDPLAEKLLDAVLATARHPAQQKDSLDRAFEIAERLKPAESPLMAIVVKHLLESSSKAPAPTSAPAPNPIEGIRETITIAKELGATFGGGSKEAGWLETLGEFVKALPETLRAGAALLTAFGSLRAGAAATASSAAETPAPTSAVATPAATATLQPEVLPPLGEIDVTNPATIQRLQRLGGAP